MYNSNGHHPNGGNYTVNNRMQQTQQQQQHVTSPPLSNSSSSSSSTISSSGLSVNTVNGGQNGHMQQQLTNGQHHQTNGHMQQQINNAYQINNQRQNGLVDYNNYAAQQQQHQLHQTPVYNLQQQINTSSTSSSSSSSSVGVGGGGPSNPLNQHPLYQSSPIPPPPPPPSVPAFSNQNNSHDNNHPQKIYDVIPDNSNYTPSVSSVKLVSSWLFRVFFNDIFNNLISIRQTLLLLCLLRLRLQCPLACLVLRMAVRHRRPP